MGPWDEEAGDVGRVKTREETETNELQADSIWEIPSNVTTDIPQSLEEAIPNPYPVRTLAAPPFFRRYISQNSTPGSRISYQSTSSHTGASVTKRVL